MTIETQALKSKWVDEFDPILKALDKVQKEFKATETQINKTGKASAAALKPMPAQTGKATMGLKAMASGVGGLATGLGVGVLALKAFEVGLGSITAASDRMEEVNKASLVFGDNLGFIQSELKEFGRLANSTQGELTQFATGFGVVFNAFGVGEKQGRDMSVTLTKLSADFASLNNLKGGTAEASERLQKTLAGEHENAKELQIIINESILKQELQAMGTDKLTGMELERAKVMARYNIILRQSNLAQGDAIRTADGFANSTRGLKANIQELSENLGAILLPVAEDVVWAMKEATAATSEAVTIGKSLVGQVQEIDRLMSEGGRTTTAEAVRELTEATAAETLTMDASAEAIHAQTAALDNLGQIHIKASQDTEGFQKELVKSVDSLDAYNKQIEKLSGVSSEAVNMLRLSADEFKELQATNAHERIAEINSQFDEMAKKRAWALNTVNGLEEIAAAANSSLFQIKGINEELIVASQQEFLRGTRAAPFMATSLETGQANKQLEENKKRREKEQKEAERSLKSLTTAADSFAQSMESVIGSVVSEGFGAVGDLGLDFLGNEESVGENARRLADIALGRFDSEAAKLLEQERPDLFEALFASGDPAGMAQSILKDFQAGVDSYGLIDIDKAVMNVKRILIGQQATADVNKQVMEQLLSEGFDESTIAQALGDKMATAKEALSGGLVDAEQQLKLQELTTKVDVFGDSSEMATDKLKTGIESTNKPNEDLILQLSEILAIVGRIDYVAQSATASIGGMGSAVGVGGQGNTTAPPPPTASSPPPIAAPAIATPSVAPTTAPRINTAPNQNTAGGSVNRQPLVIQLDGTPLVSLMATVANNQITQLTRA